MKQLLVSACGDRQLIARIWHGKTRAEDAEAYLAFLRERAIADYQGTPGNRGVFLLRRLEGETAHFLTITHRESLESIRAFAGDDISRAKYYPIAISRIALYRSSVDDTAAKGRRQ